MYPKEVERRNHSKKLCLNTPHIKKLRRFAPHIINSWYFLTRKENRRRPCHQKCRAALASPRCPCGAELRQRYRSSTPGGFVRPLRAPERPTARRARRTGAVR